MEEWLRGALHERVAAGFADWAPMLEPLISSEAANGVWNDFLAGRTTWSRAWSLHVLNTWVKREFHTSAFEATAARTRIY